MLAIGLSTAWAETGPRFSLRLDQGRYWLVDPVGQRFFSLGINVVNRGMDDLTTASRSAEGTRHRIVSDGYRASSHYASTADWAAASMGRLERWGFRTIGGWSDWELLRPVSGVRLAYTPVLHMGSAAGLPWRDLWDPRRLEVMKNAARERTGQPDPRVIGRYSDNELDWWRAALFRETLNHPLSSGQRQQLVSLLREQYQDDWNHLLEDFETEGARSFDELERSGQVYLRPGSDGIHSYRRFLALLAAQYYRTTSAIVRRLAPGGLVLGDRYRTSWYPEQIRSAVGDLDVISTNLKAGWNDGTFPRFYLDSIHELSGKPIIVSEIYLAAHENRSGNLNSKGGFPTVASQSERAAAARRSLLELARLPYVIGVDWFQFHDQPPGGRFDGEDFNMGLIDIEDRPYDSLVNIFSTVDLVEVHEAGHASRLDAGHGVPPAPADPAGHWRPFEALREWDRERGFIPASSEAPFADLYLAWNPSGIWVGLYAMDMSERDYYRNRVVPEIDRMRWRVKINGMDPELDIRIGTALPGVHEELGTLGYAEFRTLAHDTRAIAVAHIPVTALECEELKSGDVVRIESVLDAQARAGQVTWKGQLRLAE